MPRYPNARKLEILAQTRQRLLDAALAEFSHYGYDAANVERISKAASFAKGTFYNHFASKRALMEEILDSIAALHCAYLRERVLAEADCALRLRIFYQAGFAFVAEYPDQARLAFSVLSSPDAQLNERLYQAYQPLLSLLAQEILLPGAAQGTFSDRLPMSTVGTLMALYLGAAAMSAPSGRPWQDPAQVAGFALSALRAPFSA